MRQDIRIQAEDFDPAAEADRLALENVGAVATFTGLVRGEGRLTALTLEHFPAMTEKALGSIAGQAGTRWSLAGLTIIHRIGSLAPGERIVFVGAASRHRGDAIDAMHFVIDWLKTDAPFWKRETYGDGRSRWIDARAEDGAARDRW